ncbi:MAG: hypothetical protein DCC58_00210, partial [Chloroflexi bacterium]
MATQVLLLQRWQLVQVVSHTPVSGLQRWHGPHTFALHCPVAGSHSWQVGHGLAEHTPVAGSHVWHLVHFGTHTPLLHFWHRSQ